MITRRVRPWLLLSLIPLGSCHPPPDAAVPGIAGLCRLGPDGGPPPDQGLGGTGIRRLVAERGLGGTGGGNGPILPGPASPSIPTDRGTGGTGIVGIITGFGSVCVNGLEVAYAPDLAVQTEQGTMPGSGLRAGDVAVMEATTDHDALLARSLAVRTEVTGPITSIGADGLVVAGQTVRVDPAAPGAQGWQVGDWIGVSGLRDASGSIIASRIDPRPAGLAMVRGKLVHVGSQLRIGDLVVQPRDGTPLPAGRWVVATGRLDGDTLLAARLEDDVLLNDPFRAFSPDVGSYVMESRFIDIAPDSWRAAGWDGGTGGDLGGLERAGIIALRRGPGGRVSMTGWRPSPVAAGLGGFGGVTPAGGGTGRFAPIGGPAARMGGGFQPAPMPRSDAGALFHDPHFGGAQGMGAQGMGARGNGVGGDGGGRGMGPAGGPPGPLAPPMGMPRH